MFHSSVMARPSPARAHSSLISVVVGETNTISLAPPMKSSLSSTGEHRHADRGAAPPERLWRLSTWMLSRSQGARTGWSSIDSRPRCRNDTTQSLRTRRIRAGEPSHARRAGSASTAATSSRSSTTSSATGSPSAAGHPRPSPQPNHHHDRGLPDPALARRSRRRGARRTARATVGKGAPPVQRPAARLVEHHLARADNLGAPTTPPVKGDQAPRARDERLARTPGAALLPST